MIKYDMFKNDKFTYNLKGKKNSSIYEAIFAFLIKIRFILCLEY